MTMLSGLTSMFAQPAFQAVAAGLLTGAVIGSTVVASGIFPREMQREDPKFVALLACPGGGPELARVPAGQQLLITARSEDGAWLEVYIGEPGVEFAWAPAPALRAASALDALPVSQCDTSMTFLPTLGPPDPTDAARSGVPATVAPTVSSLPASASPAPTATPTAKPTPTPKPSKTPTSSVPSTVVPPPTPTPTPAPTVAPTPNAGPVLSNLSASPNSYCLGPTSTITVNANDPDGVQIAQITYTPPGSSPIGPVNMTYMGGTSWRYFITPSGWNTGFVAYHVTAYDTFGAPSTVYNVNSYGDPSYLVVPDFC